MALGRGSKCSQTTFLCFCAHERKCLTWTGHRTPLKKVVVFIVCVLIAVRCFGFQKSGNREHTHSFCLNWRLAAVLAGQRWWLGSGLGAWRPAFTFQLCPRPQPPPLPLHKPTITTLYPSACIYMGGGSFGDTLCVSSTHFGQPKASN